MNELKGNEKIMSKIKKLLALSNSPSEAEAKTALEKAHELLKEYNLSAEMISKFEDSPVLEKIVIKGGRTPNWKKIIFQGVAMSNYCMYIRNQNIFSREFKEMFIGKEHNVFVAEEMTRYLINTVERLAKNFKGIEKQSYKLGIATTLYKRLKEIYEAEKFGTTNEKALIVVEESAIQKHLKNKNMRIRNESMTARISDSQSYSKGQKDGNSISLDKQIVKNNSKKVAGYLC